MSVTAVRLWSLASRAAAGALALAGAATLLAAALLAAALLAAPQAAAAAALSRIDLAPLAIATQKGATGAGQTAANLYLKDQSGSDDDPAKYVLFQTPSSVYAGYRRYTLPPRIPASALRGMTVTASFRGPAKAAQAWRWSIYDWTARRWVALGDNAAAVAGTWSRLTFRVGSPLARFVSAGRELRVRLQSATDFEEAALDHESLAISYDAALTSFWRPALETSWQIQYSGKLDPTLDVDVYNLDGFDTPQATLDALRARGVKLMCYVSAGSWEDWRPDAASFPAEVLGKDMEGWDGEKWLDIRRIDLLRPIMEARLDLCRAKGFHGVDPDNVEGYRNDSGFPLTAQDQLAYNRFLANEAHRRGLSIGLKNDITQVAGLLAYFDWQLNEECFSYGECDRLKPFVAAGKPVFQIEYALAPAAFCPQANALNFNSLKKRLALDATRVPCR